MCISNENFKFLDVSQFLAPGHSYSSFLKAYEIEETKGFFPYRWFDNEKKLDSPCLPERADFFNDLRNEELSESDYETCKKAWEHLDMKTFKDYVVWYNNLDVGPFVKAVSKMQNQYFEIGLDVFKTAISLPGLSKQILFDFARKNNAYFSLIDKRNADLYQTMRNNVVGGPSVIFYRQAEKNKSKIRQGKTCQKVIGYDCNSLYLWALDQELPVGIFVRRQAENHFRPEIRDVYIQAYAWLDYLNLHGGTNIRHYSNAGSEKRIGPYPVDGYDESSKTVYQFMGCYHHGHLCKETKNVTNSRWLEERTAKLDRTRDTTTYIQGQGFTVVALWECEFKLYRKQHPEINAILEKERPDFFRRYKKAVTEDQLIQGVKNDLLFGYVECDIEVPQSWAKGYEHISPLSPQEYFREMSPIFCTSEIPFEVIGSHSKDMPRKCS
ncbi:MAG: DNA polymerase [Candidatus Thiodiazotropha sp.]